MTIRKTTRLQLATETAWTAGMARTSKISDFDFTPEPGMLYVTTRAISSRVNANYDGWPAEELRKAYRTFVGRGVFVDHNNWDTDRSRGVILDSRLYEDRLASGHDDTWIELLIEVDSQAFPKLARAILSGDIDAVSMGADVEYTVCSVCSNKAHDVREYCAHIPAMKGRTVQSESGERLVFEDCYGVNFFEISFVFDPADESALISDVMLFEGSSERTASHVRRRGERVDQYRARLRKAARKEETGMAKAKRGRRKLSEAIMALPDEVDTAREDKSCPVCGKEFDGLRCDNCGYEEPPAGLGEPNTDALKQQQAPGTAVDPNAPQAPDDTTEAAPVVPGDPEADPALDEAAPTAPAAQAPAGPELPADPEIVAIVDEALKEIVKQRVDTLLGGPKADAAAPFAAEEPGGDNPFADDATDEDAEDEGEESGNPFAEGDESKGEKSEDDADDEDEDDPKKPKKKPAKGKGNPFAEKAAPKKSRRKTATGEMSQSELEDPDSEWYFWKLVADEVGGQARPFDKYQGPYIEYAGHKFWLTADEDGREVVFDETTEAAQPVSDPSDVAEVADAIRGLAKKSRRTSSNERVRDIDELTDLMLAMGDGETRSLWIQPGDDPDRIAPLWIERSTVAGREVWTIEVGDAEHAFPTLDGAEWAFIQAARYFTASRTAAVRPNLDNHYPTAVDPGIDGYDHRCLICNAKPYEHAWHPGVDAQLEEPEDDVEAEDAREIVSQREALMTADEVRSFLEAEGLLTAEEIDAVCAGMTEARLRNSSRTASGERCFRCGGELLPGQELVPLLDSITAERPGPTVYVHASCPANRTAGAAEVEAERYISAMSSLFARWTRGLESPADPADPWTGDEIGRLRYGLRDVLRDANEDGDLSDDAVAAVVAHLDLLVGQGKRLLTGLGRGAHKKAVRQFKDDHGVSYYELDEPGDRFIAVAPTSGEGGWAVIDTEPYGPREAGDPLPSPYVVFERGLRSGEAAEMARLLNKGRFDSPSIPYGLRGYSRRTAGFAEDREDEIQLLLDLADALEAGDHDEAESLVESLTVANEYDSIGVSQISQYLTRGDLSDAADGDKASLARSIAEIIEDEVEETDFATASRREARETAFCRRGNHGFCDDERRCGCSCHTAFARAAHRRTAGPVDRAIASFGPRIEALDAKARKDLEDGMAIDDRDRFEYQQTQSAMFAAGRIDAATAQYLYMKIGESGSASNGGWPEGTTLVDKVVVTKLVAELVEMRIRGGRKTAFTEADVERTFNEPGHLGYGLALVNDLDGEPRRRVLRAVADRATELGLTYEELLEWSNAKHGRWLMDTIGTYDEKSDTYGTVPYDQIVKAVNGLMTREEVDGLMRDAEQYGRTERSSRVASSEECRECGGRMRIDDVIPHLECTAPGCPNVRRPVLVCDDCGASECPECGHPGEKVGPTAKRESKVAADSPSAANGKEIAVGSRVGLVGPFGISGRGTVKDLWKGNSRWHAIVEYRPEPGTERVTDDFDPVQLVVLGSRTAMKQFERHRAQGYYSSRSAKSDGPCTCWDGYERVPGTEPCESGSCRRRKGSARTARKVSDQEVSAWLDEWCAGPGAGLIYHLAAEMKMNKLLGGGDIDDMNAEVDAQSDAEDEFLQWVESTGRLTNDEVWDENYWEINKFLLKAMERKLKQVAKGIKIQGHVHTAHCGEEGCPCEFCGKECGGKCAMARNKKGSTAREAVAEGSRTPWGSADIVEELAPGVWSVSTPGHGGVKCDAAANKRVRALMAAEGLDASQIEIAPGWYEEDVAWAVVAMAIPEAFPDLAPGRAREVVDRWFRKNATTTTPQFGDEFTCDSCKGQHAIDFAVVVPGNEEILCPSCAGVDWESARLYNVGRGLVAASVRAAAPKCKSCGTGMEVVPALYPESASDEDAYEAECPKCGAIDKGRREASYWDDEDGEDEDYARCVMCKGPLYLLGGQWARCRNCGMDQRVRTSSRTASGPACFYCGGDIAPGQERVEVPDRDVAEGIEGPVYAHAGECPAVPSRTASAAMIDACPLCGGTGCPSCFATGIVQYASKPSRKKGSRTAGNWIPWDLSHGGYIELSTEAIDDLSGGGSKDEAAAFWADLGRTRFEATADQIRAHLKELGAWDDSELADDEANLRRLVWTVANDIAEGGTTASRTAGYGPKGNWAANWLECQVCGREFTHWVMRVNHYKKHHPDVDYRTADTGPSSGEAEMPRAASVEAAWDNDVECPICGEPIDRDEITRFAVEEGMYPDAASALRAWDEKGCEALDYKHSGTTKGASTTRTAGSTNFLTVAEGTSMKDAFRAAVDEARFMHGHGGYSGTIAEKSEFVDLTRAASGIPADRVADVLQDNVCEKCDRGLYEDVPGCDHASSPYRRLWNPVNDKWGPAGGIDLGGGRYLFFGWASL